MTQPLKNQWREWYQDILPSHARANNWPVWQDHCVARIIYDHVAGAKWDNVWNKPAIRSLSEEQLKQCIKIAHDLKDGAICPHALNTQSLIYRNKLKQKH
jgi:hypothetical protein